MIKYLLDTNIVSFALRQNSQILQKIEEINIKQDSLLISCITYFEIRRGFLAVDAPQQRQRFEEFCLDYQILFLDDLAILEKAAEIHANLKVQGLPIQTEDILIAATAIIKGLTVVSNDQDFARINGLSLENWLKS